MALPKWVFVSECKDTDGSKYLNIFREQTDAAEESEGAFVGTYQLVKKNKLELQRTVKVVK